MENPHQVCYHQGGRYESWDVGRYPIVHVVVCRPSEFNRTTTPLQVYAAGPNISAKGVGRGQKGSRNCSVELVRSGCFFFRQGEREYEVPAGGVMLLRPGENREMRCVSDRAEKFVVMIRGALLGNLLEMTGLSRTDVLLNGKHDRFDRLLDEIWEICRSDDPDRFTRASGLAYPLLLELSLLRRAASVGREEFVDRAVSCLAGNIRRPFSLRKLCGELEMGRSRLYALFARHFQATPGEYFREMKLRFAAELLRTECYSVKEVAYELSFSSPQYFSAEFRRRFGLSPGKYAAADAGPCPR